MTPHITEVQEAGRTGVELTIRRPNGTTETVDVSAKFPALTEALLTRIAEETRKAGRGEVLGATRYLQQPESATCDRCGCHVDAGVAYRQIERSRWQGRPVAVTAYYCEPCRTVLSTVGQGEHSALDARRSDPRPDNTPLTKD